MCLCMYLLSRMSLVDCVKSVKSNLKRNSRNKITDLAIKKQKLSVISEADVSQHNMQARLEHPSQNPVSLSITERHDKSRQPTPYQKSKTGKGTRVQHLEIKREKKTMRSSDSESLCDVTGHMVNAADKTNLQESVVEEFRGKLHIGKRKSAVQKKQTSKKLNSLPEILSEENSHCIAPTVPQVNAQPTSETFTSQNSVPESSKDAKEPVASEKDLVKETPLAGIQQVRQQRVQELDTFPGYEEEILKNCVNLEKEFMIPEHFLISTKDPVSADNRQLLLDWLVQVQVHEELSDITYQLTVQLLDQYVTRVGGVSLQKLQLVGITCLLLASKYEDRYPPPVKRLVYLTDKSYTEQEVLKMEWIVMNSLSFKMPSVTVHTFITSLVECLTDLINSEDRKLIKMMTYYILDVSTLSESFSSILPSVKSVAGVALAFTLFSHKRSNSISPSGNLRPATRSHTVEGLCRSSGMLALSNMAAGSEAGAKMIMSSVNLIEVTNCMERLLVFLKQVSTSSRKGMQTKYASESFMKISQSELIQSIDNLTQLL